jgi:hypothetical protein
MSGVFTRRLMLGAKVGMAKLPSNDHDAPEAFFLETAISCMQSQPGHQYPYSESRQYSGSRRTSLDTGFSNEKAASEGGFWHRIFNGRIFLALFKGSTTMIYALFVCMTFASHPDWDRCEMPEPVQFYATEVDCRAALDRFSAAYRFPESEAMAGGVRRLVCLHKPDTGWRQ